MSSKEKLSIIVDTVNDWYNNCYPNCFFSIQEAMDKSMVIALVNSIINTLNFAQEEEIEEDDEELIGKLFDFLIVKGHTVEHIANRILDFQHPTMYVFFGFAGSRNTLAAMGRALEYIIYI